MSPFVVSVAFEFGYGCATLPKPPAGKFVQGIEWSREQLAYLAREIHPNAFMVLQQTLNELEKCGSDLNDLLDSEVDDLFDGYCEPIYANGDPLEDVYEKWMDRVDHFQIVAADGLEESPCRDWYRRGYLLGRYAIMGRGSVGPEPGLNTLKDRIRLIPEALLKHGEDPSVNGVRACLARLAYFDFAKEGIEAWVREDTSRTESHNMRGVKDFRGLIRHVRYDITALIRNSPLENLLPNFTPSPPHGPDWRHNRPSGQSDHPIATPTVDVTPALSVRQYEVLEAMLDLEALTADRRCTTAEIAKTATGTIDADAFKESIADLKKRGLIATKEGRGGGCWLTPEGAHVARRLSGEAK